MMEKVRSSLWMWGYVPAASVQRAPLLLPTQMTAPASGNQTNWRSVCGGGCGFALAVSESGEITMWGSSDDLGQLQAPVKPHTLHVEANFVHASAGWAHSVAVTDLGNVYSWGWSANVAPEEEHVSRSTFLLQGNDPTISLRKGSAETPKPSLDGWKDFASAENCKRTEQVEKPDIEPLLCRNTFWNSPLVDQQRVSTKPSSKQSEELEGDETTCSSTRGEDLSVSPRPVLLALREEFIFVAAGGRHTLALSKAGKIWGWGYGKEGQLGLGSRIGMICSPQHIPCIHASPRAGISGEAGPGVLGKCMTAIACGGRHSAVLTDNGSVLTFGWGAYGQCGQGNSEDQLTPVYVCALGGIKVTGVAAGLWHTTFLAESGDLYVSGGNQFGQLGTGGDLAEMLPTLVDAPALENDAVTSVSCGARHTAVLTETGKMFCWGWNKYGQLGVGDTHNRDTPMQVRLENAVAKSMACGWWHTMALVEEDLNPNSLHC